MERKIEPDDKLRKSGDVLDAWASDSGAGSSHAAKSESDEEVPLAVKGSRLVTCLRLRTADCGPGIPEV